MPLSPQRAQSKSKPSITKGMSILGAFAACLFAIAIPCVYNAISINGSQQALEVEAAFLAKSIENIIQARPDLWEYEMMRLKEDISIPSFHGHEHERELFNAAGKLVTKTDFKAPRPIISVSANFFDSGQLAGSIVVKHSIRTQIITTALIGILGSLLGGLIYYIFRTYPVRKLENTLIDLQRERDKSDKTLYAIGDGVISVDPKGKILLINRVAESLVGMDTSEAVGRQLEEVYVLRKDQENRAGEKGYILTGKGGNKYAIEEVRTALTEIESDESGVVIVFRDITERKRTSEALQRAHDELEQRVADRTEELMRVNEELQTEITERNQAEEKQEKLQAQLNQAQKMEAIGQLAGGVAHDFNNMLNIILGYSQLALMKIEPSSPLNTDLQEIMNATRRSADLVRQLLAFARKQIIAPKVLDINDTVGGMLNMLRRLIGEDIDLLWKPDSNIWPVKMDPTQVDQLLANLAVNARDSISGVGKITIETGEAEFDEAYCAKYTYSVPGQYVILGVSDDGCGMDKETCEQIFDPFFTTKEFGKGTGMGLATVYGIVKQNNGFINVYSEPGKGTTFKIYLPRHGGEAEEVIDKPRAHTAPLTGNETVLLVEDNEALLKMSKIMLEELGYTVLALDNPNGAIQLAEQYSGDIHLLLTDVVMPEMSGRDLQKRISDLRPGIKCLFISGYTANVIAHRGILDEGVNFLHKPFQMEELAAKVREALDTPSLKAGRQ